MMEKEKEMKAMNEIIRLSALVALFAIILVLLLLQTRADTINQNITVTIENTTVKIKNDFLSEQVLMCSNGSQSETNYSWSFDRNLSNSSFFVQVQNITCDLTLTNEKLGQLTASYASINDFLATQLSECRQQRDAFQQHANTVQSNIDQKTVEFLAYQNITGQTIAFKELEVVGAKEISKKFQNIFYAALVVLFAMAALQWDIFGRIKAMIDRSARK